MNETPSDATIKTADLKKIHNSISKNGSDGVLNQVAERESSLAAYVLFTAFQICEEVRASGAPAALVVWVQEEVTARLLVVIEAQHLAQQNLWRDLLPEPEPEARQPRQKPKGDDNGRKE